MIRPELQVKLKLSLSLLLKNQIEVLLLPSFELEQLLKEEKEENPFLEEVYINKNKAEIFDQQRPREIPYVSDPFEEFLKNLRLEIEGKDLEIALELVSRTDERGYLREDLSAIAQEIQVNAEYLEEVRRKIMRIEPLGVCSKDFLEFAFLQIEDLYPEEADFLKTRLKDILSGKPIEEEAKRKLSHLRTSPIVRIQTPSGIPKVDAVIELDGDQLKAYLYEEIIELKPSNYYMELYRKASGKTKEFLKDYFERFRSFQLALKIRRENLKRILERIVDVQGDFLKGKGPLKSLLVKDIASELGVSESTVSRLVNSKFVRTPQGTYPLRFFFVRESVGGVSQEELMRLIKELIEGEDKSKPLSDEEIARILNEKGITVARRTVAKYREMLGIPSSRQRRKRA